MGGPFGLGIPSRRPGWFTVATGVAIDGNGRVYVADFFNHRIQVFDAKGRFLSQWGDLGTGPGRFDRPTDIALDDEGNAYVVDFGNHRVQKFAPVH